MSAGSSSLRRRGLLAVGLLAGFYALSIGVLLLCVGSFALTLMADVHSGLVMVASVAVGTTVLRALITVDRRGRDLEREGCVPLSRHEHPALWQVVDEVAQGVSSPPPAKVLLTSEMNAAVLQAGHFLGLRAGTRTMLLGLPLLAAMSEVELRAVLAHEYGHYLGGDTRVGAVLYRGASGLDRVVSHVRYRIVRELFMDYYRFFLRVSQPISRAQELAADDLAATHFGAEPLRNGLASLPGLVAVWRRHLLESVQAGWALGLSVVDPFTQVGALAARQPALRQEALRAALVAVPEPLDSHPPLRTRLARLGGPPEALPDTPGCLYLLHDVPALESQLRRHLMPPAARAFAKTDIAYADLGERVGQAVSGVRAQRVLDAIQGLPTTTGRSTLGHLLEVLANTSTEQRANLARNTVGKGAADPDDVLLADVRAALGLALVEQGRARCEIARSGPFPYTFVPVGRLDVDDLAEQAVSGRADAVVRTLRRARVDLGWRPQPAPGADIRDLVRVIA